MNDPETIAFLQARLIERTEQSTATAYRDAETIRRLRLRIMELEEEQRRLHHFIKQL